MMDSPSPPSKKSASVSRSSASQQHSFGSMADALLSRPPPHSASSMSTTSRSRDGIGSLADAMLQSSLSRNSAPAPAPSASMSRSKASQHSVGAAAEALLRAPAPRSVSSTILPAAVSSMSRPDVLRNGLGAEAEARLRSPVTRPTLPDSTASASSPPGVSSSTSSSMSSWALSGTSRPPSYRTSQPPSYCASEQPRRDCPLVVGATGPTYSTYPTPPLSVRSRPSAVGSPASLSAAESKQRVRQMLSAVDRASATVSPRNTTGLFRSVCSTDLLFLLDTTSSMQDYIDAAKDQIRSIIASIQRTFLGESVVRVAVVGYKDHGDLPNVEFLDFTTSMDDARAFLANLQASGGADIPEDVLGGLWQASNASWMQQTRCIIHITDAPGHSRALHDLPEAYDSYYTPGTEPHRLTYAPVLNMLIRLGIDYTFLHLHAYTNRMVLAFSRLYDAAGANSRLLTTNQYYSSSKIGIDSKPATRSGSASSTQLLFQELPMGIDASSLHRLVLKSVTDSVTRTSSRHSVALSSSRLTAGSPFTPKRMAAATPMLSVVHEDDDNNNTVHVPLETGSPQWNSPGWLDKKWDLEGYCPDVVVFSASTLGDMMSSDSAIKLGFTQLTVHARSKPFAQGAQRLASYARMAASARQFVVKSSASGTVGLEQLIEDMRMQALCKAFALEFNGLVRPEQSIDFVVTACLQSKADVASGGQGGCLSLEPYLAGEYVKYNNNTLYINEELADDPINQSAQAFSHFTFERSWGDFLVVDLQGVGNLLTDPAIHTKNPDRFKLNDLNLSSEGFKCFFAMHSCNGVCRQLGLVSNREMAISGEWRFREAWPAIEPTVCCSNKFCQSIIRLDCANVSLKYEGYRWCNACWPELRASTVQWICAAPGDHHEFDMCRFFYTSQGKLPPRKCPQHMEKDTTASSTAAVGGGLWSHMKTESKKKSVLGHEY